MILPNLEAAIVIDLITVLLCGVILARYGRLAHSHPMTIYLFFHLMVVTFRLVAVKNGAPTLFTELSLIYEPITVYELTRASLLYDLALIVGAVAALRASRDDLKTANIEWKGNEIPLQLRHILRVVSITLPIGLIGLLLFARIPGANISADLGEWSRSSWLSITVTWSGLALLALIYWYGNRIWLIIPIIIYLGLMFYQGYHRFRVIIPILLLIQIYLDRHRRKWPNSLLTIALILLGFLFFPLKRLGEAAYTGTSLQELGQLLRGSITDVLAGQDSNQAFLDMFASSLTLADLHGKFFWGMPYLKLLILPIPRQLWPGKPGLADHIFAIQTPWRPIGQLGQIMTYLGEAYVNFWYVGIIVVPFVLMYVLTRTYFRAYRSSYYTIQRFAYLLIAVNLIQVYRDGLTALVLFTAVNMMPLTIIVLLHYFFPSGYIFPPRKFLHIPRPSNETRLKSPQQAVVTFQTAADTLSQPADHGVG